jgi:hypothetical protein
MYQPAGSSNPPVNKLLERIKMTNYIFINPQLIAKIEEKVNRLMIDWEINPNERHMVYQMTAAIESGVDTKVFYHNDGIVCDGWNGYRHYQADRVDPDPRSAFQGFYRTDKYQMIGWSIYLIAQAANKEKQAQRCQNAYGHWFVWEDKPMCWGFVSFQDYYTPEEQEAAASALQAKPHVKRVICEPKSKTSWMYRLRAETTRKKSGLRNEWRERIAR